MTVTVADTHYENGLAEVCYIRAVVATARKLAVIYYQMNRTKTAFNPHALSEYQKEYKEG